MECPQKSSCGLDEAGTRQICFVCTGNTCRSPMAAAILNAYGKQRGLRAVSAGLYPDCEGAPMTDKAITALEKLGIESTPDNDFLHHETKQITEAIVAGSYSVYGMSSRHAMTLLSHFPQYAAKISSLGKIPDPFGGDQKVYDNCCRSIAKLISETFALDIPELSQ